MKKEQGFSLIELLMVMVIIGVIAAIAVPGLRRARQQASAGSAIQSLRTITTAQHLYERKNLEYASSLAGLEAEGTIDSNLASGVKSGYSFTMGTTSDNKHFTCTAIPIDLPDGLSHFFVDETGVIRFNEGASADASSPPIPR
jgi:prepilin-type N-terminal cleavage/methylation domain-containing protein